MNAERPSVWAPAIPIVLGLIFAGFYVAGAAGTISSYRDSGDFIAAATQLGIAHPPGYAVYTTLAHAFLTLIPWGNAAYRLNVFSGVAMAASLSIFLWGLWRRGVVRLWPALIVTIGLGSRPAMVALSRVPEMYALAVLFSAGILALLWSADRRAWPVACLLWGLAFSAHPTALFLFPLFLAHGWSQPKGLRTSAVVVGATCFALGLSILFFLPIRAHTQPLANWGSPDHWRNFWRVVSRADYGGLKLHPTESVLSWTPDGVISQLTYFLKTVRSEWTAVGLVLILFGALNYSRSRPGVRSMRPMIVTAVLLGPGFFLLANLPIEEHTTAAILQPALVLFNLIAAVLVAVALDRLWNTVRAPWGTFVGPALILLVVAIGHAQNQNTSYRDDVLAFDYGRNMLRSLPAGAVLYDPDDTTAFTVRAWQALTTQRLDVIPLNFFRTRWGYEQIVRRWPDLLPNVPIDSAQQLESILWNYSVTRRPFFVEVPQKFDGRPYVCRGIVYAFHPPLAADASEKAPDWFTFYTERGLKPDERRADFFSAHVANNYAAAHSNAGLECANRRDWACAETEYKRALIIDPTLTAAWNNWGIVCQNTGRLAEAVTLYRRAATLEPSNRSFQDNLAQAIAKIGTIR